MPWKLIGLPGKTSRLTWKARLLLRPRELGRLAKGHLISWLLTRILRLANVLRWSLIRLLSWVILLLRILRLLIVLLLSCHSHRVPGLLLHRLILWLLGIIIRLLASI